MPEFIPTGSGGARLLLDDAETAILRGLVTELRELIADQDAATDPVIDRLFPNTYEDPDEEAKYAEIIGDDLNTHKLEALDVVGAALDERGTDVTLDDEGLDAWLASLTDMRLAIGTRLGVDEETMSADVPPDHPNARAFAVLHWLGALQEGLLRVVS